MNKLKAFLLCVTVILFTSCTKEKTTADPKVIKVELIQNGQVVAQEKPVYK